MGDQRGAGRDVEAGWHGDQADSLRVGVSRSKRTSQPRGYSRSGGSSWMAAGVVSRAVAAAIVKVSDAVRPGAGPNVVTPVAMDDAAGSGGAAHGRVSRSCLP